MDKSKHPHIERAAEIFGSGRQLAFACGLPQQRISRLMNREFPVTMADAMAISRATDGRISLHDLLPEIVEAVAQELGVAIHGEP